MLENKSAMYLLDANVLIRAHEDYYPLDRIPQFWDWLLAEAEIGRVKMPFEIYDEIASGRGALREWITGVSVRNAIVLGEEVDQAVFNSVVDRAYAADLTEEELEETGRDPFLVTYGMMGSARTIVTKEISRPGKRRGRRKVPDACDIVGVRWITDFAFYRELNFRIA